MSKFLKAAILSLIASGPVYGQELGLGRVALPEEVAAWNIDVRPDGQGLPPGRGTVATGEEVFAESCAICHGDFGEAVGRWPVLAGGLDTLGDEFPVKTVGSYWPYLSTVWDYVNRAMPFGAAQSLTDDEIYAIVAYLLYVNDLVDDEDFELNSENFTSIKLPNEGGFYMDDRAERELPVFSVAVCMTDCKSDVKITKTATVLDVTPDETRARQLQEMVEAAKRRTPATVVAEAIASTPGSTPVTEQTAVEEPAMSEAPDPELVAAGEKLFKKCKACHQVGDSAKNRTGPVLNGVVDRAAGQVDGFKYSKKFRAAAEDGLIWDDANLAAFLTKPKAFIKGTKMSFSGFKKPEDIAAMVAYLRTFEE